MMYLPEISVSPSALTSNQNSSQITASANQQEQQQEMFDDIVANTNPVLQALPDAEQLAMVNLYMNHNHNFLSAKRTLFKASNSDHNFYGFQKSPASDIDKEQDKVDFNDYDIDFDNFQNDLSDFSEDDD